MGHNKPRRFKSNNSHLAAGQSSRTNDISRDAKSLPIEPENEEQHMVPKIQLAMWLTKLINKVWWSPRHIQRLLRSQGVKGLSYSFSYGNTKVIAAMRSQSMGYPMGILHDMFPRIQPHVYLWRKIYGTSELSRLCCCSGVAAVIRCCGGVVVPRDVEKLLGVMWWFFLDI